jgi:hypothetical protein
MIHDARALAFLSSITKPISISKIEQVYTVLYAYSQSKLSDLYSQCGMATVHSVEIF